mgnify:CR=1 FL=1
MSAQSTNSKAGTARGTGNSSTAVDYFGGLNPDLCVLPEKICVSFIVSVILAAEESEHKLEVLADCTQPSKPFEDYEVLCRCCARVLGLPKSCSNDIRRSAT